MLADENGFDQLTGAMNATASLISSFGPSESKPKRPVNTTIQTPSEVFHKYKHRYYVNAKTTANSGLASNQSSTPNIHQQVGPATAKAGRKHLANEYMPPHKLTTETNTPAEFFNLDSHKAVRVDKQRTSEPPVRW